MDSTECREKHTPGMAATALIVPMVGPIRVRLRDGEAVTEESSDGVAKLVFVSPERSFTSLCCLSSSTAQMLRISRIDGWYSLFPGPSFQARRTSLGELLEIYPKERSGGL